MNCVIVTKKEKIAVGISARTNNASKDMERLSADYTVVAACEAAEEPSGEADTVCRIPAGRYAKFVVCGDMVQAVAKAWQEVHIYVGIE